MEKLLNYMLYTHDVHVIWVDETTGIMIPIEKINKNVSILKKKRVFLKEFYIIFHSCYYVRLYQYRILAGAFLLDRDLPQRSIYDPVKYLWWSSFAKNSERLLAGNYFLQKFSITGVWQGPKYTSD